MLLTSAQVSVAISSFIVFFFTSALFLSGYVLQQQTVRDLRAAIQPQLVRPPPTGNDLYLPPKFRDEAYWEAKGVVDALVKVKERVKAEVEDGGGDIGEGEGVGEDRMVGATRWQKEARRGKLREKNGGGSQKVISETGADGDPELREGAEEEAVDPEKPSAPPLEEKLSPAERRKRIKAQILAEGEGEGFKGYRRRMW